LRRQTIPGEAVALLERAIALGVDHIDTAQFYGNGFVNGVIRQVLRPGDEIVVAIISKVVGHLVTRYGAETLHAGVDATAKSAERGWGVALV
jgi:aryl-alcohol dehydrogenase-like predicted oxidoreductase